MVTLVLLAATDGWVDITDRYVARYGAPIAGTMVFVRTCQHIDGHNIQRLPNGAFRLDVGCWVLDVPKAYGGHGEFEPAGWCLGREEFRQELLVQASEWAGPVHRGQDIRQSAHQGRGAPRVSGGVGSQTTSSA